MDLSAMRRDYRLARDWWRDRYEWSEDELAEADQAVAAAVKAGDDGVIACWADWLAGIAAEARAAAEWARAVEADARAEALRKRQEEAA